MGQDDAARRARLADQAVGAMVHQFVRPMDFVRELVQNALDARSPDVEVSFDVSDSSSDEVVISIAVADRGVGMDEAAIDGELTCLFASDKEGDLRSIGQFGVGFTSVFAVRPAAVAVRTGRRDQSWEVWFHPDLSFDKVRLDAPVVGTTVTVMVRVARSAVGGWVRDLRSALSTWCEHTLVPVWFVDRRFAVAGGRAASGDDPLVALGSFVAARGERIDRPLTLDGALLQVHVRRGDVDAVVGYAPSRRYGFYSGGLTLALGGGADLLGRHAARCGHWTFKVRSPRLATTLTRDNVKRDAGFHESMAVVREGGRALLAGLVGELARRVAEGEEHGALHGHLAEELAAGGLDALPALADAPIVRMVDGSACSLRGLARQAFALGGFPYSSGDDALDRAAMEAGIRVVADDPQTRRMLGALPALRGWVRRLAPIAPVVTAMVRREVFAADRDLRLLRRVADDGLDAATARLLARAGEHLERAGLGVALVAVAEGGVELAARVAAGEGLAARGAKSRGAVAVAVDVEHAGVVASRALALVDAEAAALSLAHQIALSIERHPVPAVGRMLS